MVFEAHWHRKWIGDCTLLLERRLASLNAYNPRLSLTRCADDMFRRLVTRIGVLRALLASLTIFLIAMAPFAGGQTQLSGWAMVPTLIVPAIVPMLLFVLPLDMTMSGIYQSSKPVDQKPRYKFIILMDAVLLAALILAWLPFFYDLLRGP